MKKHIILGTLLFITSNAYALTLEQIQNRGSDLLQALVSAHTNTFGHSNLLTVSLDLDLWNKTIAEIKSYVTTIINANTNFFGMRDSTLVNGLDKITKADIDLVNCIKISHGLLKSPSELAKQAEILTKIANNMIALQKTFTMKSSSAAKNEAQKILKNVAVFIEVTATKTKNEINATM